ncbi:MAG: 3-dehydroquinate synthase [Phycisphaerales bacterium]|nr:3-dehydroquinate synthase [Phycisphaerales bacterium]
MAKLILKNPSGGTRIVVQAGALDHIGEWIAEGESPPIVVVCTDQTVAELYGDRVVDCIRQHGIAVSLYAIPPGDASKSPSELNRLYDRLGELHVARDGMLLALGGGVVSDLTGFAAATWMRGIRYMTCPTTLESDVDACVGGKTGINIAAGKNLVGAFHHPQLVAVDPECLSTLPARDVSAGLAESIKHALICDAEFLAWHEEHQDAILAVESTTLGELVERNLRIKVDVVTSDEREHGRRAILNYGHTIGHAIERLFYYALRHGEAVALGMVAAAELSRMCGTLDDADVNRIRTVLAAFGLPTVAPQPLDVEQVLALTHGDKKVQGGKRRWVLLDGIGRTIMRDDLDDQQIRDAIASVNASSA